MAFDGSGKTDTVRERYCSMLREIAAVAGQIEFTIGEHYHHYSPSVRTLVDEFLSSAWGQIIHVCERPFAVIESGLEANHQAVLNQQFRHAGGASSQVFAGLINRPPAKDGKKAKANATVREIIVLVRKCIERAKLACRTLFWTLTIPGSGWDPLTRQLEESLNAFNTIPTAPSRGILIEIALRRSMGKNVLNANNKVVKRIPNQVAKQNIEAWKTSDRVSQDLRLVFHTKQNGALFDGLERTTTEQADGTISITYDGKFINYHYAGTPTMHFICAHNWYVPENLANADTMRDWIVGSTRPKCRLFAHANEIYTMLREEHLGTAHMNAVGSARRRLEPIETAVVTRFEADHRRVHQKEDFPLIRPVVITDFHGNPSNMSLVGRTKDYGISISRSLKPTLCCFACRCIYGYRSLFTPIDQETQKREFISFDWKDRIIEHCCAESAASMQCALYNTARNGMAHQ
ncbi:hypothetical protein J4E85_003766 [Alternaria conjuncta]|uniref:uncharacterized protein n=1 Tax=Alternaria conjuncta TaxID=181017 RepID=UPI00221FEA4C|nr:uncharacterized protein J4E85_003766 [Alternaria conjuncta]KAI4931177.1 hypothetical protein J4E85_003766 [Alternaria conjuncta]